MSTTAQPDQQTSIYETTIDDPDLEKALEERETLKATKGAATKAFNDATTILKAKVGELDLGDAPVRCGRFVIRETSVPGGHVSFEKNPSTRLRISLLAEDA